MSGKTEKDGALTVPAKIMAGFVNNLPSGKKVEIEAKGNNLLIKCENYRATIKGLPADDFPIIPNIKDELIAEFDGVALKNGLDKVAAMAAVSELRPEITGVLFKFNKGNLKLAATDSFRLAEYILAGFDKKNQADESFIVPQRTVQELIKILGERQGQLKLILGGNQILLAGDDWQLVSRLVEGQYPDYQQIIPNNYALQVTVDKNELVNTVRLAGIFSSKINDVQFVFRDSKLEVISQDSDLGENKSVLSIEAKGKDLTVSFNYRYFLDGLQNIEDKKIFIGLGSESAPAVLKGTGNEKYLYVIMPIKGN
ncbi:MAG: polymerase III subunit beta protein [Parcubacteria group bacterium GW2011_GWC2_42_6]|nr:MAG: polymerase III subunit beta protein [Parcubacteria group bacterium GW2011_GWC2_42_6]